MSRVLLCLSLVYGLKQTQEEVEAVVIEDLDDFARWAFQTAGLKYNKKHEYNLRIRGGEPLDEERLEREGHITVSDEDDFYLSSNPAAARPSFLEIDSSRNPFSRDTDDLPPNPDFKGQEHYSGSLDFLLVSTFDSEVAGSGEVWVVPPTHQSLSFVLIGGLETPTGLCFDVNNRFLYVCDPAQGSILQFEIDANQYKFVLRSNEVATVYSGTAPTTCAIDAYGNLYYTDLDTVGMLDYLNLWAGYSMPGRELFDSSQFVSAPVGVDVRDSKTVFWANSADTQNSGVVATGAATGDSARPALREDMQPQALAVDNTYIYFPAADGSVWAYSPGRRANLYLKTQSLSNPHGICYSNGRIYVSDVDKVVEMKSGKEEDNPRLYVRIKNPYSLACINH